MGKAVKDRRHEVILSTKCGLQWYDDGGEYHFTGDGHQVHRDLRPQAIRRDLEDVYKRQALSIPSNKFQNQRKIS